MDGIFQYWQLTFVGAQIDRVTRLVRPVARQFRAAYAKEWDCGAETPPDTWHCLDSACGAVAATTIQDQEVVFEWLGP